MATTSNSQVVQLRSAKIAPHLICPICKKLLNDATSITECLHTFCRKCIYNKITEEDLNTCPECNIDLGCAPLEKLRPDHLLQDLTTKIFASVRRETKEPEVVAPVPLPARRKERSLSSLVSTPNVSKQTVITKRRKPAGRKPHASRGSAFPTEEPIKKLEDCPESSSSPVTLSNAQNKKQNSAAAESSEQHMPNKSTKHSAEPLEGISDLWKPLNCLVEAAGMTKSLKSNAQGSVGKSESSSTRDNEELVPKSNGKVEAAGITKSNKSNPQGSVGKLLASSIVRDNEEHVPKSKAMERSGKSKIHDDETGSTPAPSVLAKPKKKRGDRQKKAIVSEGTNIPAQAVVDAANSQRERRVNPIWFTLVASDDQEGDPPLPPIPPCYIRIKEVNLPVSFIQKYVAQKLNLDSEDEAEITLRGQPVLPTLQLHNLIDLWAETESPSTRVRTSVGSSAKDFVMVLGYGRKAQPS